jgi:hypothetical protein
VLTIVGLEIPKSCLYQIIKVKYYTYYPKNDEYTAYTVSEEFKLRDEVVLFGNEYGRIGRITRNDAYVIYRNYQDEHYICLYTLSTPYSLNFLDLRRFKKKFKRDMKDLNMWTAQKFGIYNMLE